MSLNAEFIEMLACPKCKKPVRPDEDHLFLICDECRVKYKIDNNIPIMLQDEAIPLDSQA